MSSKHAIVVDPDAPARLALREVEAADPAPDQALVRVATVSLNRGEVTFGVRGPAGARMGYDLAGTVERAAADGAGPAVGARVVGIARRAGSWAEEVAVPTRDLAVLPDGVSFAQAATLPVAGLTALRAVGRAGDLLGRAALVTGASGGVGLFATRLAALAGARVVGQARRPEFDAVIRAAGADEVVTSDDIGAAATFGPYDLIVDVVGGGHSGRGPGAAGPVGDARVGWGGVGHGRHAGPAGPSARLHRWQRRPADPLAFPRARA